MARVTVEDCLARVPNRFALTILASRRARALLEGKGKALVECDNKSAVTALREISADKVRYIEDVDTVMHDFIAEQRSRLQASTGDGAYIDAAAFGGEEGDVTEDIEELTADLEKLGAGGDDDDDEDSDDDTDAEDSDGGDDDDDGGSDDDDDLGDLGDLDDDVDLDDDAELDSDDDDDDDDGDDD